MELETIKNFTIWFTGFSGSGKTTLAVELGDYFRKNTCPYVILDGDMVRKGLNSDLSFSQNDRTENIRRASHVSKLIMNSKVNSICCFISPLLKQRQMARRIIGEDHFIEIYLNTSIETCRLRDPKGLYNQVSLGLIKGFTGIDSVYEPPKSPHLVFDTAESSVELIKYAILTYLKEEGFMKFMN